MGSKALIHQISAGLILSSHTYSKTTLGELILGTLQKREQRIDGKIAKDPVLTFLLTYQWEIYISNCAAPQKIPLQEVPKNLLGVKEFIKPFLHFRFR